MAIEWFTFESTGALAIGVFIILFAISNLVLRRFMQSKGVATVVALIVSIIATFGVYKNGFYGFEEEMATLIYVMVIVIFAVIIFSFF